MREIGRFLGMFIFFCDEKTDEAHFHVRYNEHQAVVGINAMDIMSGSLPPRVADLAVEWAMTNKGAIEKNWALQQQGVTVLPRIPSLV